MKTITLLFICIIFPFTLLSASTPIDSLKSRISILEAITKKEIYAKDSLIQVLETERKKAYQAKDSIASINSKTEKESDYNKDLLDKYDWLTNYLFASIGLLLAVSGFAGYFFLFKPAREDVKEVHRLINEADAFLDNTKNNLDEIFDGYFEKYTAKLIDKILTGIELNNSDSPNRLAQLEHYQYETFNEKQYKRLYELANKKDMASRTIIPILGNTDNIYADMFHTIELKMGSMDFGRFSIKYVAKFNKIEFIEDVATFIFRTNQISSIYNDIKEQSNSFALSLLNNEKLVDGISPNQIVALVETYLIESNVELRESLLYKAYLKIKDKSKTDIK
jgi:hypothetical protein